MPTPALRPTFVWDQIGTEWFPVTALFAPETGISKANNKPYWKLTVKGNEKTLVTRTKRGTAVPATDGERVTMWLEQNMFNLMQSLEIDSGNAFHLRQGDGGYTLYYNNEEHYPSIPKAEAPASTDPPPPDKPEEDPLADTPLIREPKELPRQKYVVLFERYYAPIMDAKLEYMKDRIREDCGTAIGKDELLQTLWELDKSTSANVSTILIQNGK